MHAPSKIPVILATGFLGSGKTTLLRRLAESHPDWRLLFLVNEIAETSIDGDTLAATGTATHSVVGGSLFCECKAGDFLRIMRNEVLQMHRDTPLDAVVIETSGTADPDAIGQLMHNHGLSQHFEVRRIITVVAPARFLTLLENLPVMASQVQASDLVIINKTDTVDSDQIEAVESAIRILNPNTEITHAEQCRIDFILPERLAALPRGTLSTCDANPFDTVECVWPSAHNIQRARTWLNELPPEILRIKGKLQTPEGYWIVERTVDTLTIEPTSISPTQTLVMIAHEDDFAHLQAAAHSLPQAKLPMPQKYALLACDVFQEELTALGGVHPLWQRIEYLEMGLHDQPDNLRVEVQTVIERLEADPDIDTILLAYGLCGNGLLGIRAARSTLILPRAHDCISILLGGMEPHSALLKENPGTYFYSPGWIRGKRVPGPDREAHIRETYSKRYPDDKEMVDDLVEADLDAFAHHHCAAYVDITENTQAENYCKDCARHLGWQFRKLQGDPSMLQNLLQGDWDPARFLIIPPGHQVAIEGQCKLISRPS